MTSIGRPEASKEKIFGPRDNSSGSVRAATQKKKEKIVQEIVQEFQNLFFPHFRAYRTTGVIQGR